MILQSEQNPCGKGRAFPVARPGRPVRPHSHSERTSLASRSRILGMSPEHRPIEIEVVGQAVVRFGREAHIAVPVVVHVVVESDDQQTISWSVDGQVRYVRTAIDATVAQRARLLATSLLDPAEAEAYRL